MNTPHKWAHVIKAFADGATIQYRNHSWPDVSEADWHDVTNLNSIGLDYLEWRVKPNLNTPGQIWYESQLSPLSISKWETFNSYQKARFETNAQKFITSMGRLNGPN